MGREFDTNHSWIFDGEYITQNKRGEPIQLYMVFDVYYTSKEQVQPNSFPWYSKSGNLVKESFINLNKMFLPVNIQISLFV